MSKGHWGREYTGATIVYEKETTGAIGAVLIDTIRLSVSVGCIYESLAAKA